MLANDLSGDQKSRNIEVVKINNDPRMVAKETLESTEPRVQDVSETPDILKTAREAVERNIVSAVSSIKSLARDAATKDFNHSLINRSEVILIHEKLVADLKLVTSLHDLYCFYKQRGRNEDSQEELINEDEKYISALKLEAHRAIDVQNEYEKSFTHHEKERASRLRKESTQRAQAEADADRLEKLSGEMLKKEGELARNRREILEQLQSIPAKDMPGNSDIMMCPTDDMIQDFPERFGKYKRTVNELEGMLADRGYPKDDIKRKLEISALGIEQGEFAKQLIYIKRIQ